MGFYIALVLSSTCEHRACTVCRLYSMVVSNSAAAFGTESPSVSTGESHEILHVVITSTKGGSKSTNMSLGK